MASPETKGIVAVALFEIVTTALAFGLIFSDSGSWTYSTCNVETESRSALFDVNCRCSRSVGVPPLATIALQLGVHLTAVVHYALTPARGYQLVLVLLTGPATVVCSAQLLKFGVGPGGNPHEQVHQPKVMHFPRMRSTTRFAEVIPRLSSDDIGALTGLPLGAVSPRDPSKLVVVYEETKRFTITCRLFLRSEKASQWTLLLFFAMGVTGVSTLAILLDFCWTVKRDASVQRWRFFDDDDEYNENAIKKQKLQNEIRKQRNIELQC